MRALLPERDRRPPELKLVIPLSGSHRWLFALLATWLLSLCHVAASGAAEAPAGATLLVQPTAVLLDRPEASQQVVVTVQRAGRTADLSRDVTYQITPPTIARIDARGVVRPLADGMAQMVITAPEGILNVPLTVSGQSQPPAVSFQHEIIPLLNKGRCNSGGCHGKAEGQNGFKLSLLGFDPEADYQAIAEEARGRRLNRVQPAQSLILSKGTALVPHGGGKKIDPQGADRQRLERWIASGAPATIPNDQPIVRIELEPALLKMTAGETYQLRVTAINGAGERQCATVAADYFSNADAIVTVDSAGLLRATDVPGEAAILVRYLGHVATCRVTHPRGGVSFPRPPEHNFVDHHIWDKLTALGIPPADLADDATFLRRASLDVLGTLPTAAEARKFLSDPHPDKRARLVDELLQRPEYADFWAMKWSDLLRADKLKITPQGTVGLTRWLRTQFAANRPYDELVREILTEQGPVQGESPASFFKALDQPEVASRSVSQLFLGVRIECAQCHHHPSERWGQDDYVGLAGFFTGVKVKRLPDGTEAILSRGGNDLPHPRTGVLIPARALGAAPAEFSGSGDRRRLLANWMTRTDNPYLAPVIANRVFAHYFGRGLVEPLDDFRSTNPATNEPLLVALADHMRAVKFDLKAYTRTLLTSRAYQLSSLTSDGNCDDLQNYSHALQRTLPAEVLLDAVSQATSVPEKFNGWPLGVRAIQVWDNRMPSYFFRIFGRPVRATVCECERSNSPSISQALHLLNSPEMQEKLSHPQGRIRQLALDQLPNDQLIDELYLTTLTRFPTLAERDVMQTLLRESVADRRAALEDALWALLNSKEFLYNH